MSQGQHDRIAGNLEQVERRIREACSRAGRQRDKVTLIAVTKTRSEDEIFAAYRCGVRHFGENRIEELEAKLPTLRPAFAADPATWHMIGHVQSRKAQKTAILADAVHSVDSLRLAQRLNRFAAEKGKRLPVLLEMNVSGEASKYGFLVARGGGPEDLVSQIEPLSALGHLEIRGLMTMAPMADDPAEARPVFRQLGETRDLLRQRLPFSSWDELSMGMTDDFEVAIEEGATLVRIGRAIFGPREY